MRIVRRAARRLRARALAPHGGRTIPHRRFIEARPRPDQRGRLGSLLPPPYQRACRQLHRRRCRGHPQNTRQHVGRRAHKRCSTHPDRVWSYAVIIHHSIPLSRRRTAATSWRRRSSSPLAACLVARTRDARRACRYSFVLLAEARSAARASGRRFVHAPSAGLCVPWISFTHPITLAAVLSCLCQGRSFFSSVGDSPTTPPVTCASERSSITFGSGFIVVSPICSIVAFDSVWFVASPICGTHGDHADR